MRALPHELSFFQFIIKVKIHFSANDFSNRHKFAAGLVHVPNFVFSFTTLITLSLFRCISVFLANNQLDGGMFLSAINTRSLTTKLRVNMFHFLCVVMMGKYSRIHLCQNGASATSTASHFHLFVMPPGFSTGHINKFGLTVPVRKWLGVNASKSFMSSLRGVKGRPWMDSVSVKYVYNVSLLKR